MSTLEVKRALWACTLSAFFFQGGASSCLSAEPRCSIRCEGMLSATSAIAAPGNQAVDFYKTYQPLLWQYQHMKESPLTYSEEVNLAYRRRDKLIVSWLPKIGSALVKPLSKYEQKVEERSKQRINDWLEVELTRRINADAGLQQFEALFASNAREAVDVLLQGTTLAGDDWQGREAFVSAAIKALANQIEAVKGGVRKVAANVESLRNEVKGLSNLRKKLQDARNDIDELSKEITSEDGHGPIATTVNGAEAYQAKEEAMRRQIRAYASRVGVVAQNASDQLSAAASIFQHLDPELGEAARKASGVSMMISGLSSLFVNPAGMLPLLANGLSLFGGGGPDPTLQAIEDMHRQVMARLDEIEDLIRRSHQETMAALRDVKRGIIDVLSGIEQVLVQQANTCSDLIPSSARSAQGYVTEFSQVFPRSPAEIRSQYSEGDPDRIDLCLNGLIELFPDQPSFHTIFILRRIFDTPPDQDHGRSDSREEIIAFLNSWKDSVSSFSTATLTDNGIAGLADPALRFDETSMKMRFIADLRSESFRVRQSDVFDIYNYQNVIKYGGYIAALHNWFEWRQAKRFLGTQGTGNDPAHFSQAGLDALKVALRLVDAAVAQQALLMGDTIVPLLWEFWNGTLTQETFPKLVREGAPLLLGDTTAKQAAISLLKQNPLLARNFALYHVLKRGVGTNLLGYYVAFSSKELGLMERLVGTEKIPVEYINTPEDGYQPGWFLRIQNVLIPLPTADEVKERQFLCGDELTELFFLRDRLRTEILGYSILRINSADETKLLELARHGIIPD
jgi:hypothetical protein